MSITSILAINLHSIADKTWLEPFEAVGYNFILVNSVHAGLRYLLEQEEEEISMALCRVEKNNIEDLALIEKYAKMNDIPILFISE